jgi:hypothetical protein
MDGEIEKQVKMYCNSLGFRVHGLRNSERNSEAGEDEMCSALACTYPIRTT